MMDRSVVVVRWLGLLALLMAGGCSDGGADAHGEASVVPELVPAPISDPETGERVLKLRVLTYNVEGLPWPIRKNRRAAMERIGDEFARMRAEGRAPHIVFLQEGFIEEVERVVAKAGYPFVVRGPRLSDTPRARSPYISARFREQANPLKGEGVGKWLGSGLLILSAFPIEDTAVWPFSRDACAGYDCSANKGVLLARVRVPGLPMPLQVFTTHLNSHQDTDVPPARSRAAHRAQVLEMRDFLAERLDPDLPLIFGGDFNTKEKPRRYAHLEAARLFQIVREACALEIECGLGLPLAGERPWLDSQDLQGFRSGSSVRVRPSDARILLEASDGPDRLSDHDGYLVTYELRWRAVPVRSARRQPAGAAKSASLPAESR